MAGDDRNNSLLESYVPPPTKPTKPAAQDVTLFHASHPLSLELARLENQVRDKDRELGDQRSEIKALKYSDRLKGKAVEEVTDELHKADEKLKLAEALLESKHLEIKKITEEKKSALAAQFAAEATLRRVHAAQKDDQMPPIEAIIAPLEAELKLARQEIANLMDDNRALDRLTKSKEAALLEAEKSVQVALTKASFVDDLQNKNQELLKQIEICQEENKILDKMHQQKVIEVEKLTHTVHELEEDVLAGGAAANAVRDYQRKVQEMIEEKKTLDRELARARVSANRVAVVVANDWKDANDKVMPVKQWLEERRFLQGEMQQLKDKLAIAERTAKAEAALKEKYQLRFKVLEGTLKADLVGFTHTTSAAKRMTNGPSRRQSMGGAENLSRSPSNGFSLRRTNCQTGSVQVNAATALLRQSKVSPVFEDGSRSVEQKKLVQDANDPDNGRITDDECIQNGILSCIFEENENWRTESGKLQKNEDCVSGVLYDMLQKEVITMRKACLKKDQGLKEKDNTIEMLAKKVETLNKAIETESKKMRRDMRAMEKEFTEISGVNGQDHRAPRRSVNGSRSVHLERNS
ncbi:microtubule-associated protein 70-2 isoform X1 [Daucus carota subsp. sativus]|uniref:microtubule-associated protein 70-2 isoform X1 n=1 Tax=Daucus carota subsp. sativus TaxID=79200 RepID=UPI0007EF620F|nr:PREDICTED: microtubule-associated protein 70-2-like isoform X1 [Daucus carota subsp. sativus]